MAKSKAGGTRAYIRGKIGADVYSIGKDGKGRKQQVVRSLAEQVKNPQTTAQMRGRMIMSTIMQVVAQGSFLFDHSFDNVPTGQPSISEFIRKNYALIKTDVAAHEASGNSFGLNKYQEKGAHAGAYQISAGAAVLSSNWTVAIDGSEFGNLGALSNTAKAFRDAAGLGVDDYVTFVYIDQAKVLHYARVRIDFTTLSDATAITSSNIANLFSIESDITLSVSISGNLITFATTDPYVAACGIILSKKVGASYEHNDAVMTVDGAPDYTASVALPTYPTGSERFLNGGDI